MTKINSFFLCPNYKNMIKLLHKKTDLHLYKSVIFILNEILLKSIFHFIFNGIKTQIIDTAFVCVFSFLRRFISSGF